MNIPEILQSDEAIDLLDALENRDSECSHCRADGILLAVLRSNTLFDEVAMAYERAAQRVGFWYA